MKRVLVTGARGFLGRRCLRPLLERGFEVAAAASSGAETRSAGVDWYTANLLDRGQMERLVERAGASHLLHLAWFAKPGTFWSAPENLDWVEASQGLLRRFRELGGVRAVGAGSCAEYAEISGTYGESATALEPRTVYGRCKHALQLYLSCLSELTGLSSAWARIFFLYGPGGPPEKFPQTVVASISRGEPARCSHGRQLRDFLHVDDAGEALAALLDSSVNGPVNVGSGQGSRLATMAERLAARCGRSDLLQLGALPARKNEPAEMVADVSRLKNEVGWTPRIECEAGLDALVDAWPGRGNHEEVG